MRNLRRKKVSKTNVLTSNTPNETFQIVQFSIIFRSSEEEAPKLSNSADQQENIHHRVQNKDANNRNARYNKNLLGSTAQKISPKIKTIYQWQQFKCPDYQEKKS